MTSEKNFQEYIQKLETARNTVLDVFNGATKIRQQTQDASIKRFLSKAFVELESTFDTLDSSKGLIEKAFAVYQIETQHQEQQEANGSQSQSYKPSRRMQEQNS